MSEKRRMSRSIFLKDQLLLLCRRSFRSFKLKAESFSKIVLSNLPRQNSSGFLFKNLLRLAISLLVNSQIGAGAVDGISGGGYGGSGSSTSLPSLW